MIRHYFALTILFVLINPSAMAYEIGGAYAQLLSCKWEQYGYEYGYLGTYRVNNQIITHFFGSNYCPA